MNLDRIFVLVIFSLSLYTALAVTRVALLQPKRGITVQVVPTQTMKPLITPVPSKPVVNSTPSASPKRVVLTPTPGK